MSSSTQQNFVFIAGVAEDNADFLTYLCVRLSGSEVPRSRLTMTRADGSWVNYDLPGTVVSACPGEAGQGCFALCEAGVVGLVTEAGIQYEQIPDAGLGRGKYGYMTQIRKIGDGFFACGDLHQVYRRQGRQWIHADQSIAVHDKTVVGFCFNSIDGSAPNDVYAVGAKGEVFHFDGSVWMQIDCPTNVVLRQVLCPSADDVYIVGARGTVLRGNKDQLSLASGSDMSENLWGLAEFRDQIYVSSARTVYRLKEDDLEELPIALPRNGSLLRLVASKDFLWVIGAGNIFRYDGRAWQEQAYPGAGA